MEGAAADLLFDTLKSVVRSYTQQQQEQSRLIRDAPNHVEQLENHMRFLRGFLKESIKKHKNDSLIMRDLTRDVRNGIYDAEDAIDSFLIDAVGSESKVWFPKSKAAEIAKLVESISEKLRSIRDRVEQQSNSDTHNAQDGEFKEYESFWIQAPPGKPKYVVGFVGEEQQIKDRLSQNTQNVDVIFVTGTHGVGKTTLVAKIFHDSEIRESFSIPPIWVRVSNPTTKNIFLAILSQLDRLPQGASQKSDRELSQLVADCLKGKRFLIVMDDLSEIDDNEMLMSGFDRNDRNSKILITTNNNETARFVGRDTPSIELNPLSPSESWNLLQWRVFGKVGCPPRLEINGRMIAEQCDGLPRAIVIVADIIAKKDSKQYEMNARLKIWEKVCTSMNTYFSNESTTPASTSILSSYNRLPFHLRACFLYMGIFPERSKFSVSKLIRMWIAEGFVQRKDNMSLEESAQEDLNYLIDRNLVIVDDKKPDGSAKICSMNYLLYEFCKTEAGNERENFFQEVKKSTTDGAFHPPVDEVDKYRRLCIHADFSRFITKFLSLRSHRSLRFRLRSFISHSEELCTLKKEDISIIRAAFKLLRVLDAKPMEFTKIPGDLYRLVHLRYVTLSLNGAVLPADISKLRNIQTLVVHTPSPSLKIKADLLEMTELRHFKTNASATLPKTSKSCKEGEQLQTLCGISPESCTEVFLDKALNLNKLGIRGQLALILDGRNELLRKLGNVQKLKLLNYVTGSVSKGKLCCILPQPSQFPPILRSLTLSASCLGWDKISVLGSLEKLEELKLKDNAFEGEKWEVSGKGFPHLQALHIERLDFIQWQVSSHHFPELRKLELSNCKKFMALPLELAATLKLKKLHLSHGTISAAASARKIRDGKLQNGTILDLHISPS